MARSGAPKRAPGRPPLEVQLERASATHGSLAQGRFALDYSDTRFGVTVEVHLEGSVESTATP